jgi:hypothetical protein
MLFELLQLQVWECPKMAYGLWRIFHLLERKEIYGVIKFIDIIPITYAQG